MMTEIEELAKRIGFVGFKEKEHKHKRVSFETFKKLLVRDDILTRAVLELHNRQTPFEQQSETSRVKNDRGFRFCHARRGSSMAKFYNKHGFITPSQLRWWKDKDRILVYARQLYELHKERHKCL